ncbi:hypothetical protein F503_00777 [Ophiostoma piceae UAMH 11346]|uniref:Uncharacterized protein n=1 Tax=Ophiostoma piceae (strain UAMH 11346) TaxID=1262450 RepID=S3C374_OPHP1|nr:hypothetical protein F503_00777 [Ophiostoma piceae UAMH 11346]
MLLLSAVLFGAGAQALKFNGARATPLTFDLQDIKARADAPAALPTSPPQVNAELVRRAGTTLYFAPDNTCGYLTGDSDIAYTCNNADAQCAISTPSANTGYIGCCEDGNCAGYHVACVDSEAYSSSSACGTSCRADTLTLKCTASDVPYCNSVSINGGNLKVYGYYCNNEAISTMQALYTTYNGETDGRAFTASVFTATASASQTASFGDGGSPEETSSAAGAVTSTGPSPTSSSDNGGGGGGKKSNTGAIAGGVVGGVAGLALIGAGIFFLMRHQRKNASKQPPQVGAVGAVGGAPAPGGPGAPGPGYGMSQVDTPPPPGGYYAAPTAPTQPGYYHQQPGAPPQQYYAAAAVPGAVSSDRTDSTSPHTDYAGSGAGSPQLGHDYRMSSVSAVTNNNSQYTGPISPQHTGQTTSASPVSSAPAAPSTPQVPATIHEAAGNAVGTPDYNANHRGEMAELA